jgi:mono/diheme cytochrome c family protein
LLLAILLTAQVAACVKGVPGAGGDPSQGHRVAEDWCAECHRVSPDQPSGMRPGHVLPPPVDAPSFMTIAHKPYADRAYLSRFLSELHLPMPTFRLSAEEREDVIAYLLSLGCTP